jgi:predicted transcriptional regulator
MREQSPRMLESLGLTDIEERVYETLVERTNESLDGLAHSTGAAKARVRSALANLEQRGLVARSAGRRLRFVPAPPAVAIEALILKRQEELTAARLTAERLESLYRNALQTRRPSELVEVLEGADAVKQHAIQLERAAATEILSFYKPPFAVDPEDIDTELELLARGVRHRFIYEQGILHDPPVMRSVVACTRAGEEARTTGGLPMKLAVFDRKVALVPVVQRPQSVDGALLVHSWSLLDGLIHLFESYWERAVPIAPSSSPSAIRDSKAAYSDNELALLTALLSGLKSQAIARQMGVAISTVERRIKRLMTKLGAETRFQAGYQFAMNVRERNDVSRET